MKRLYNFYNRKIFPHISHIRGATRIKIIIRSRLLKQLEKHEDEPQSIFERGEWDNLIILDACRYDKYNEMRDYEVESRITLGSTSSEYVERTFEVKEFGEIVYISANGFLTEEVRDMKLDIDDFGFFEKFNTIKTSWDKELGTVLPKDVVQDSLTAEKLFPDKKKNYSFYPAPLPLFE